MFINIKRWYDRRMWNKVVNGSVKQSSHGCPLMPMDEMFRRHRINRILDKNNVQYPDWKKSRMILTEFDLK